MCGILFKKACKRHGKRREYLLPLLHKIKDSKKKTIHSSLEGDNRGMTTIVYKIAKPFNSLFFSINTTAEKEAKLIAAKVYTEKS